MRRRTVLAEITRQRDVLLRVVEQEIGEIGPRFPKTGDPEPKLSIRQCRIIGIPETFAGNYAEPAKRRTVLSERVAPSEGQA
jgi:hypothetical protein